MMVVVVVTNCGGCCCCRVGSEVVGMGDDTGKLNEMYSSSTDEELLDMRLLLLEITKVDRC